MFETVQPKENGMRLLLGRAVSDGDATGPGRRAGGVEDGGGGGPGF